MKKIIVLLFVSSMVLIQDVLPQEGSNAGAFLRKGLDSRALALGGAYTSVTDDVSSIYWNPAGLNGIEHHSFNMMFSSLSLDRSEMFFGYGYTMKNIISLGVGVYKFGVSDIPYYGNGREGKFYEDSEYSIMLSAAKEFYYGKDVRFSVGLTTKYLSHTLEKYSAKALSFDLGLLATINERYRIGFVWQDMFEPNMDGNDMTDSTDVKDNIPSVIRIGGSFYPYLAFPLIVSMDLGFTSGQTDVRVGLGARLIKNFGIRTGLVFLSDGGDERNILLTFGFFIWYQLDSIEMQLDYAGKQDRISGLAHYITLAVRL